MLNSMEPLTTIPFGAMYWMELNRCRRRSCRRRLLDVSPNLNKQSRINATVLCELWGSPPKDAKSNVDMHERQRLNPIQRHIDETEQAPHTTKHHSRKSISSKPAALIDTMIRRALPSKSRQAFKGERAVVMR